jgi:outer membrane protein assembly factor BamD (BamD/ComL family)
MLLLACGCGPSRAPAAAIVNPEEEADRVLAIAADLEKQGKTRQAFAAYHQVITNFPGTPAAKVAAARVRKAQSQSPTTGKKPKQ